MNETLYTLASALISSSFFKKDTPNQAILCLHVIFPVILYKENMAETTTLLQKICASPSLAQSYPWEMTLHLVWQCHSTHQCVGSETGVCHFWVRSLKAHCAFSMLSLSLPVCREHCIPRGRHKAKEAWESAWRKPSANKKSSTLDVSWGRYTHLLW